MRAKDLVVRCFATRESDGSWFTICLDLNLYARGDSFDEANKKLGVVMRSYLTDALTVDSKFIGDLIPRRAPLYFWIRYAMAWCCQRIDHHLDSVRRFKTSLPMVPQTA